MAGIDDVPQSVEEAGALLGAAITRYGTGSQTIVAPPKGMHSSFGTNSPVPSSELLVRLHSLRALLRSAPQTTPLVAAPSLLAGVLLKLLGVSSSIAAAPVDPNRRTVTPPMLSTALRKLWVDCVVLCHRLGEGLSGNARINIYGFVRNMISLAGMNPRTAKAAGGTRVAALEAIAGLFEDDKLCSQLSSWSMDIIQLVQRALKSSGNGEPTYRVASVHAACAAAIACRQSSLKLHPVEGSACLVLKGALEDKAIIEVCKLLRVATMDKFPEIRSAAASLAGLLAPLLIHTSVRSSQASSDAAASSPTVSLEDVMTIAFRNLDDESPEVSAGWADALARCMSTAIEYSRQLNAENTTRRDVEGGGPAATDTSEPANRRKGIVPVSVGSSLPGAIKYLVGHFVKAGGELMAPRCGGTYSTGGRAVRLGFSRTLVQLLRLQSKLGSIGEGRGVSLKESILIILTMVGSDMEAQLNLHDRSTTQSEGLDATSVVHTASRDVLLATNPLFGQLPKKSHADPGIARMATSRVLRHGIVELASETAQLSILHDLINLSGMEHKNVNGNQLQVILIEISHLIATLGEAAASTIDDMVPAFKRCLRHGSHGVRHEAAVATAAFTSVFPSEGRLLVQTSVNDIQLEHAELMAIASTKKAEAATPDTGASRFLRFGKRAPTPKETKPDESLKHQYAVHGLSLMVSMVIRDLPSLPGGLPDELLGTVLSVAEILASTLFNDIMTQSNPSATCTSVRAGFCIISGVLTTGPNAIARHIALIFGLWQKAKNPSVRSPKFTVDHELLCVDSMLTSIVAFLRYCSELLLSIPDALSRTSLILEELLPPFLADGKLGSSPMNPSAAARWQSAKASIMEAFSWLPPGSYPMAAESVFAFATTHIQEAVHECVTCSILQTLVNKEDVLLDSMSYCRASSNGQVGGARDLDHDITLLISEVAHHGEREAVIYFLAPERQQVQKKNDEKFRESHVLGLFALNSEPKPPTPLHAVGTWRVPVNPSCCSKIRLVDAAIQAFASTFGLKSGKEQQAAIQMLQFLVPSMYTQAGRPTMGVTTGLAEQDRRVRSSEDNAAVSNIIALLLSCLQALPLHESTHNVPIGLGPAWMSLAKDMLLTLLPSPSHVCRRAAAEGLALLATLGVSEDAHFMQSTVLHSLDEVMKGNQPDGKQRIMPVESVSAARAGSLLSLACIQRTAYAFQKERSARSRGRGSAENEGEDRLPTLQMMTRVIPSIACHGIRDYFNVRTYALHAFGVLFAYSNRTNQGLSAEDAHIVKKSVEIVEDNFLAAWTVASLDYDRGNESEKLASEPSFLAVLLRLMTFLVPFLSHLTSSDPAIATRFSTMAALILECCASHPAVTVEAMSFFEVLAAHQDLLPPPSPKLEYSENPILCCIPFIIKSLSPPLPEVQLIGKWHGARGCLASKIGVRATLQVIKMLSLSQILVAEWSDLKLVSAIFASLEAACASQYFQGEIIHRSLAAPREVELVYCGGDAAVNEMVDLLRLLLYLERKISKTSEAMLLRWILLSRALLSGVGGSDADDEEFDSQSSVGVAGAVRAALARAQSDAAPVSEVANPPRWQVKSVAVQMATIALGELASSCSMDFNNSHHFNPKLAFTACSADCTSASDSSLNLPHSRFALHIGDVVTTTCATSTSTVDQAELQILQVAAMHMLVELIICLGRIPDPDRPDARVLGEYIPQISSCIKYALGAVHEREDDNSYRLFMAGCEVLRAFIQAELTSDKTVLKRVVRGSLLTSDEVPFFEHSTGLPEEFFHVDESKKHINHRSSLLVRIAKVWALGIIPAEYVNDVKAGEAELGAHAAALAIDGACLLVGSGLNLCGYEADETLGDETKRLAQSGFFYRNVLDIDDSVRHALAKTWASNCCSAINFLTRSMVSDHQRREACLTWVRMTVPLVFAGLRDSVSNLSLEVAKKHPLEWARGIDVCDVATSCMQGMTFLVQSSEELGCKQEFAEEIEEAIAIVSRCILLPSLGLDSKTLSPRDTNRYGTRPDLVSSSCELILCLARSTSAALSESSALLVALLNPLCMLQNGSPDVDCKNTDVIVSACMNSMASLIARSQVPSSLVKPMLPIVLDALSRQKNAPEKITKAAGSLLNECLAHSAINIKEHCRIAVEMAKTRNWEAWTIVASTNDGLAIGGTMHVVQEFLLDGTDFERQLEALGAVHKLVLSRAPPDPLVARVAFAVGAEVLGVLQAYSTMNVSKEAQSHRTTACAEAMKIVLAGYQQLVSDRSQEEILTGFLVALFESFIALIRYNGLPNHPPPQTGSDPALGRICAQAILHVARTSPNAFKTCMASLSEHDRAVLEFAVRAEMGGYSTQTAQAPTKKKLSLKGFKK